MLNPFRHHRLNQKGFTMLELMISLVILAMLALFAGQLYLNFTSTSRDIKAAQLIYEEARFLMEKIVREVRQNAIDYEEYFTHNVMTPFSGSGGYGSHYCAYSSFFYDNRGESIGRRNQDLEAAITALSLLPAAVRPIEDELYLINISGNQRTFFTRVTKDVAGEVIGKVAMLKLVGQDFGEDGIDSKDSTNGLPPGHNTLCRPDDRENDGKIDTWHCAPDFPCQRDFPIGGVGGCNGFAHRIINNPADPNHSFVDISPNVLNVVSLKFMIAPEDDPWKAYNMNAIQYQPHVTIQLSVEANPRMVDSSDRSRLPSVTLTSTVSTRNYDEINSDCR